MGFLLLSVLVSAVNINMVGVKPIKEEKENIKFGLNVSGEEFTIELEDGKAIIASSIEEDVEFIANTSMKDFGNFLSNYSELGDMEKIGYLSKIGVPVEYLLDFNKFGVEG